MAAAGVARLAVGRTCAVDVRDGRLVVAYDGEPRVGLGPGRARRAGCASARTVTWCCSTPRVRRVWRTGTAGQPGAALVVEDQAVLLRTADGATLWQVAVPERLAPAGVQPTRCEDVDGPSPRTPRSSPRAGIRVHPCLADALDAMLAAAADDGVVLHGGGWRSAEQQIALRRGALRVVAGGGARDPRERVHAAARRAGHVAARARPGRRPHAGRTVADDVVDGVRVARRARARVRAGEPPGRAVALERRRPVSGACPDGA